jgi:hypothetical protein
MRVLFDFPPHSMRGRRYDWDLILDGRIRELERGVDFACKPSSLVESVRKAARRRQVAVEIRSYTRPEDRRVVVAVKALDPIA